MLVRLAWSRIEYVNSGQFIRRALIVGTDEHTAYLLEYLLQREGFAVTACQDGAAAAHHVAGAPAGDVVITDVVLPFVDGFELVERIRTSELWRAVPVIVLSSHSTDHDIVRALEAGANDYVTKPFNARVLLARIHRHMRTVADAGT
jgi:DNA-binding response OmpR family regulator